jgi:hypothetical protein
VHALDIDCTGPWPDGKGGQEGGWYDRKIRELVAREKTEYEHPTIKGRLQNVIWRGRVCSRSWGWTEWRPADGHFDHAHFSARYDPDTEADTRPWGVEEDDVTKSEFTTWMTEWAKSSAGREALATAVLAYDPGKAADGKLKPGGIENYGSTADENPTLSPAWALGRAPVAADLGYQIRSRVDQLAAALKDLTGKDFTDEQAIVAGVLAGLDPAVIAAAIPQDLARRVADELAARLAS